MERESLEREQKRPARAWRKPRVVEEASCCLRQEEQEHWLRGRELGQQKLLQKEPPAAGNQADFELEQQHERQLRRHGDTLPAKPWRNPQSSWEAARRAKERESLPLVVPRRLGEPQDWRLELPVAAARFLRQYSCLRDRCSKRKPWEESSTDQQVLCVSCELPPLRCPTQEDSPWDWAHQSTEECYCYWDRRNSSCFVVFHTDLKKDSNLAARDEGNERSGSEM